MTKGKRAKKRLGAWLVVVVMVMNCLLLPGQTVEAASDDKVTEEGGSENEITEETHEQIIESTKDSKSFTEAGQFTMNAEGLITGYINDSTLQWNGEVIIPAKINGIEVKGLSGTFKENTAVTKVIIPDTVIAIGDDTFNGCTGLQSVCVYDADGEKEKKDIQSEDNQWIDWSKYIRVISDTSITFYEIIDKGNCVVIPAGLEAIGANVFNGCNFASFDVMEGNTVFCDSNEGGMNLKEGVGACLMSADGKILYRLAPGFRDVNNSLQYFLPEGIEEIYPFAINKTGLQEVVVSATVRQIDEYAFYDSNLLRINFAENSNVTTIGMYAFAYNQNLDIALPASVTTIASYCFAGITNRTPDISKTQITVLPEYTFAECPNLHTITMPATLLSIEGYAFAGNANLEEVVFLGERLDKIGTGAFQGCQNMHKIDIPEGITDIENDTFSGCTNLNTVILPDSLKNIGDNAFKDCQNIHEMVIPPNVSYISNSSFTGAKQDEIDTSKNEYAQGLVGGLPKTGDTITVNGIQYKVTKSDKKNGTAAVSGVVSKKLTSAVVADTVKKGGYTFKVTAIDSNAFKKCTKLKSVTIGKNVTKIGANAFNGDKKLKKITIKSTKLKSVGKNAVKGIHKKAVIKVPKSKLSKYKKLFKSKTGYKKTMKLKK